MANDESVWVSKARLFLLVITLVNILIAFKHIDFGFYVCPQSDGFDVLFGVYGFVSLLLNWTFLYVVIEKKEEPLSCIIWTSLLLVVISVVIAISDALEDDSCNRIQRALAVSNLVAAPLSLLLCTAYVLNEVRTFRVSSAPKK